MRCVIYERTHSAAAAPEARHSWTGTCGVAGQCKSPSRRETRLDDLVKAAFHDTDTDLLAKMSARMSVSWNVALTKDMLH